MVIILYRPIGLYVSDLNGNPDLISSQLLRDFTSQYSGISFLHRLTCKVCLPRWENQIAQTNNRRAVLPSPLNSDLSKCISKIGIVALIRNYPNSLLKYWRLVIIYKCRITFSYNFSSHFASLPSPSQISSTSSDRLLPPRLVGDRPSGGRKWSLRHHWRRWRLEFRI